LQYIKTLIITVAIIQLLLETLFIDYLIKYSF
jgi:hypothetical protein